MLERSLGLASLFVWISVAGPAQTTQTPQTAQTGAPAGVPALPIIRSTGAITIDGDLTDPGWQTAAKIDRFFETSPGDNTPPKVETIAWLTYDERYFYIAVLAKDPDPSAIRAPYVERDAVIGTDDNIAVFLDTRNDRRSAIELRVNPRGIQGDAVYNDANGNEDFSPDFFYDTAAKITAEGWQAEYRIPFSTLRYPKTNPQSWGILIWRNYPRDFRYAFYNAPIPRGSNCSICHSQEISGLTGLPSAGHLVAAPYATAAKAERRSSSDEDFETEPTDGDLGLDLKWTPSADHSVDATINPDFSQIEADAPQIAVNQRFALFFPEKRPFFLEGVDLLDTPIQAVYTRTITSPRWGLRGTGKLGGSAYTVLVSEDRGGGLVVLPGPTSSDLAAQEFRSRVGIARVRHDFGASFGGLLLTSREIEGGGYNRVFGPDFQWRPNDQDAITGQFLWSDTETPRLPALAAEWDGRKLSSHDARLDWRHNSTGSDWQLGFQDAGDDFRADSGFVPQVGYRRLLAQAGRRFYPEGGLFRFVRTYAGGRVEEDSHGGRIYRDLYPGLFVLGAKNLQGIFELHAEQIATGGSLLEQKSAYLFLQFDPSRRFSRISLEAQLGQSIDFGQSRLGDGGFVTLTGTLRPTDRLGLEWSAQRRWLDVDAEGRSPRGGRLFTAQFERLKATYGFSARSYLRLIAQTVRTDQDSEVAGVLLPPRTGSFLGSLLYSYKINWQTVLFLGYGDDRTVEENGDLLATGRSLFFKISYALQR